MSTAELKLKIFREIDSLDNKSLEKAYRMLLQLFNKKDDSAEWGKLSKKQQDGIGDALNELDAGKGIPHRRVMRSFRKKYNA